MSKYSALCKEFNKTVVDLNEARVAFNKQFTTLFSAYMSCPLENIVLEFKEPVFINPSFSRFVVNIKVSVTTDNYGVFWGSTHFELAIRTIGVNNYQFSFFHKLYELENFEDNWDKIFSIILSDIREDIFLSSFLEPI